MSILHFITELGERTRRLHITWLGYGVLLVMKHEEIPYYTPWILFLFYGGGQTGRLDQGSSLTDDGISGTCHDAMAASFLLFASWRQQRNLCIDDAVLTLF
jgi:hypothetical protein